MNFSSHFQHVFRQLNHQRLHAQLCDCMVLVGEQTFQAHRAILAASSSHFRALLSSNDNGDETGGPSGTKSECGGPSVIELDPEVVTPEAFSTLLEMIYTSTLYLGTSNVMDVLLAASHLHLNAVVKACKLHLSKKNFPAAPPKEWRSVQTSDRAQQQAAIYQQVTSGLEEDSEEDAVVEVSQSGGTEDKTASSLRHKRKSEDILSLGKKPCLGPGEIYKECSPTVSRSQLSCEDNAEDLLSPDSLRLPDRLWESPGEEEDEVEIKYDAAKGQSDEIQLPSQSDSSLNDICNWDKTNGNQEDNVLTVKIGHNDEQEGPIITMVEVKRENVNSPELKPVTDQSFQCLASSNQSHIDNMASISAEADDSILQSHLGTDLNDEDKDSGDTGDDPVGLDSLSDLTFSCFLNPTTDSVMGALEEDSLASLTAAATAAAAASDGPVSLQNSTALCPNEDQTICSSTQSSDPSLGFPVTPVPLQQLVPTQSSGFADTLILQSAPAPLTGYLNSLGPGLTLEASVVQSSPAVTKSRSASSSGVTAFRRIAPKVPPGSEASPETSGEAGERPSLTKASEDVLSKCKKAASEDHVLLVEGDKKYACKICCKTFMNLTDCKKHIRVHTGEKPYPCPKCGKRFSQSSHLYKHTKNSCQNWKDEHAFSDSLTT